MGEESGNSRLVQHVAFFLRCGRKRIQYGLVITISRCYYANKRWISRFQKTCASLETPVQYEIVAMATKFTSLWDQPSSGNAKSPLWRGVASVAGVASKRTRSEWRHNVLLRATGPRDGLRIVPASTLCVLADMRAAVARFICFFTLRGCPACFLILKGMVISSHETNRFS